MKMVYVLVKSFTMNIINNACSVISMKFVKSVTKKRYVVFAINKLRKINVFASQVLKI
jgi:hypothetical protein